MKQMSTMDALEHCFAMEYIKDFNCARAAVDSGYKGKDPYQYGYNLLKKESVKNWLTIEIAKRDAIVNVDVTYIVDYIKSVLESDLVEWAIAGEEGIVEEKLKKMPHNIRKLVTHIERIDTYNKRDGELTTKFKLKFMDKNKCLEMLGKYKGIGNTVNVDHNIAFNFNDWAEQMRRKREQRIIAESQNNNSTIDVTPKNNESESD